MSDVPQDEATADEAWPEPLSQAERDQIDAEVWNPDEVKVWPLGPDGPRLTLREVAAWRAEQARIAAAVDEVEP